MSVSVGATSHQAMLETCLQLSITTSLDGKPVPGHAGGLLTLVVNATAVTDLENRYRQNIVNHVVNDAPVSYANAVGRRALHF